MQLDNIPVFRKLWGMFLLLMLEEGEIKELLSSLRDEIEKVEGREVA